MSKLRKVLLYLMITTLIVLSLLQPAYASAATKVNVYFNGTQLQFDQAQPAMVNGRTLVPFRKLFETLGFTVDWDGSQRKASGTKDGLTIELTIDSKTAKVNGKSVTLDVPPQVVSGSTMVPLRFVSENSGYPVEFTSSGSTATITIGSGNQGSNQGSTSVSTTPPPAGSDKVETYVVKGRVVDEAGKPVGGAEVWADNTFLYDSSLSAYTDADGYYRIELPRVATTYRMGGKHFIEMKGKKVETRLTPLNTQTLSPNTGAIRDFVLKPELGHIEFAIDYKDMLIMEEKNILLSITPVGDSKEGAYQKGNKIDGGAIGFKIPMGSYIAKAQYAPPGQKPVPIKVRVRNNDEAYADSVEFDFFEYFGIWSAWLEFKMPDSTAATGADTPAPSGQSGTTAPPQPPVEVKTGVIYFHIDYDDFWQGNYELGVEKDITITLTPSGSTGGTSVVKKGSDIRLGIIGVDNLPVTTYQVTAQYGPSGQTPVPIKLRVREYNAEEYKDSVELRFTEESYGVYLAELEFDLP